MQPSIYQITKAAYPTIDLINSKPNIMSTRNLSNQEIILRSNKARSIADKISDGEEFENDEFVELTYSLLTEGGIEHPGVVCSEFQTILVEVMALLSNPKISSKLSDYAQARVGSSLNNLFKYFNSLEIYEDEIEKRCDYMNLKFYNYGIEDADLNRLEQKYTKKQVA